MVAMGKAIDKVLSQPPQPSLPSPVTCHLPRQPPPLCHDSDMKYMLRQREEWIRFSYSNEDTKDEERRKGWVVDRRLNVVPSAKRAPVPGPRHNST